MTLSLCSYLLIHTSTSGANAAASNGTVAWGTEPLRVSSVGPTAVLPHFGFQLKGPQAGVGRADAAFKPAWQRRDGSTCTLDGVPQAALHDCPEYSDNCPDSVFRNSVMQTGAALPYQPIWEYGCESFTAPVTQVKMAVLENEYLRAAISPIGGKVRTRSMLFLHCSGVAPADVPPEDLEPLRQEEQAAAAVQPARGTIRQQRLAAVGSGWDGVELEPGRRRPHPCAAQRFRLHRAHPGRC